MTLDLDDFRAALARFPAGVAVVTTVDAAGTRRGFTASSFCSLSAAPPMVLVCLANDADCYPAFAVAGHFAVNVLSVEHEDLARRFATKGADKFTAGSFTASRLGLPVLDDAVAVIQCRTASRYPGGDHTILVGAALDARAGPAEPAVYLDRSFRALDS